MKRSLPLTLILSAILVAVAGVSVRHITADQTPSSDVGRSRVKGQGVGKKYVERLDPFLAKAMGEDNIPGLAIGIVEDGQLVYSRGFGVMRLGDPSHPVTQETLFHMASITKPFVATALMQLVEQGKVDLDGPVTRYVPYFQLADARYKTITVRQMVTHTSGMPDVDNYYWDKPEYDDGALERYVRSLKDKLLRWEPGTKFAYSNMAFEVLGDLVAKVSGISFENYVQANILRPLNMRSSTLLLKEANESLVAAGHTKDSGGQLKAIAHYPYNRAHTPSSNLESNVVDMARWIMANLDRRQLDGRTILKKSTHELMWTPAADVGGGRAHVGISWFLEERNGESFVTHGGGDDGFLTYLILVPNRKIGIVMMTNCDRVKLKPIYSAALETALGWDQNVKSGL